VNTRTTQNEASRISIRRADAGDVAGVTACVCAAYLRYIERIGRQPAPMLNDYSEVIRTTPVHIALQNGRIVGVLELKATDEGFLLDSIAVLPSSQGSGVGRALLEFAEAQARAQGYDSIYLMTNEKMTENQVLYARIGYVLFDRRVVDGYARVVMRKSLA
jgi:N-acetylglutamate synthase-like GNAT family acetyltransferase